jgi:hypothetical protein
VRLPARVSQRSQGPTGIVADSLTSLQQVFGISDD